MIKRHHTIRYIYDKIISLIWVNLNPNKPWLSRQAIKKIDSLLTKDLIMVETGSGRSTIWYADRVKYLTSIEHFEDWYKKINKEIIQKKIDNITYLLASDKFINSPLESQYLQEIIKLENESIDVLLIDGVLRAEIANAGFSKVKKGGFIIIDNAERYFYLKTNSPERLNSDESILPIWTKFKMLIQNLNQEVYTDGITATLIIYK